MRIGIDVDDTITNSYENIIKEIADYYHKDFCELLERKMSYTDFFDNEEFPNYNAFAFERYKYIVGKTSIKENAVNVINKLHNEGHKIIFITARHYGEYDDPYAITLKYLSKHGIEFDEIIVNKLDKGIACKNEDIDLFIDDSVSNCRKVQDAGIDVLLFDAPFNKDNTEFRRIYNWKEVYNIVNEK